MNAPVVRFLRWLIRVFGVETVLQVSLLWLALGLTVAALSRMVPVIRQTGLTWVVLVGVGFGWWLARQRWNGWLAMLLAALTGAILLLLSIGRLSQPITAILSALWEFLRFGRQAVPLLSERWIECLESLRTLAGRFGLWFQVVRSGSVILDPLVTALLWAMGLWLMAVWAAWVLRRRRAALVALAPALALLVFVSYYTGVKESYLFLALVGGVFLAIQGLSGYLVALQRWVLARLDRAEVEGELAAAVTGLAVFLTITASLLPSISIQDLAERIQDWWEARRNEELARSVGLEQTPVAAGAGRRSLPSPRQSMLIGGAPELSQNVILYVRVEGYQPLPPEATRYGHVRDTSPRFYWRARTFDRYNGHAWTALYSFEQEFAAGQAVWPEAQATAPDFLLARQEVERLAESDILFHAGTLVSVDRPYRVWWRAAGDLVEARSEAERYVVTSRLPTVTVAQLRQAGEEYPTAITARYLQLPEELPRRVRDVALDLTALQPTPYDKAAAIEAYLRGFPYDDHAPAPPNDREVVDYFLFDLQRGYCNYYATAMAVLARAAGLPARLVIGYTAGSFDYAAGHFVVREVNTHAWVEIYFPGIGWVEFEPTAGRAPIERPLGEASLYVPAPVLKPTDQAGSPQAILRRVWLGRLRRYAGRLGLGILAAIGLCFLLERWWLYLLSPRRTVQVIYRRLYRRGRRWGVKMTPGGTPNEFASRLSARLRQFFRLPALQAAIEADLRHLTELYTRSLYAPRPLSRREQREAVRLWSRLRRRWRTAR